jgi:hypothetical protein
MNASNDPVRGSACVVLLVACAVAAATALLNSPTWFAWSSSGLDAPAFSTGTVAATNVHRVRVCQISHCSRSRWA